MPAGYIQKTGIMILIKTILLSMFLWLTASAQFTWEQAGPISEEYVCSIASGNGCIVGVGAEGIIIVSKDGIHWNKINYDVLGNLVKVVFLNGRFVAIGNQPVIITSIDGIHWSTVYADTSSNEGLTTIVFAQDRFIITGTQGSVYTSSDGLSWEHSKLAKDAPYLLDMIFIDNQFIAVGLDGYVGTSPDGITWQRGHSGTTTTLVAVTFGKGKFCAVGHKGTILSSPDGITWTVGISGTVENFQSIVYGNNHFVAGKNIHELGISTSADGVTWTEQLSDCPGMFGISVIFDNNRFVAVSTGCYQRTVAFSDDGEKWSVYQLQTNCNLLSVSFGNGQFAAVGQSGTIMTSDDGRNWVMRNYGSKLNLRSIIFGNGRFVAVGDSGRITMSEDGYTWRDHFVTTAGMLVDVKYSGRQFVALGTGGHILTSPDGSDWQIIGPDTVSYGLKSIVATDSKIIAVGDAGMYTLSDQQTEKRCIRSSSSSHFQSIAFGNSRFVACGYRIDITPHPQWTEYRTVGEIFCSDNGTDWTTPGPEKTTPNFNNISFTNNCFFGTWQPAIYISSNGTKWDMVFNGAINSRYTDTLHAIAGNGELFVAVGNNGKIFTAIVEPTGIKKDYSTTINPVHQPAVNFKNGIITIPLSSLASGTMLTANIYNVAGKRVLSMKTPVIDGMLRLPVTGLPNGKYIAAFSGAAVRLKFTPFLFIR